jgi:hypothetical protein
MFFLCNCHSSQEGSATTTATAYDFRTDYVISISNDDPTNAIQFNFDGPIGSTGTFTLKAGESIGSFPKTARKLYVKAVAGTPSFRALGVYR